MASFPMTANIPAVVCFLLPFLVICAFLEIEDLRLARNFGLIGRFTIERARLEEVLSGLGLEGKNLLITYYLLKSYKKFHSSLPKILYLEGMES